MMRTMISALVIVMVAGVAGATTLAGFGGLPPEDLAFAGFELAGKTKLQIRDTGFGYRSGGRSVVLSNAWILDAETRRTVWEMAEEREEWKEKRITASEYTVELPAGRYEVYYSTYPDYRSRKWSSDIFDWGGGMFREGTWGVYEKILENEDLDDVDDIYDRFSLSIEGQGTAMGRGDVDAYHQGMRDAAVVAGVRLGDHEYLEKGFELKRKMRMHIYALGEARKDGDYDYGWIMNADTREKVWRFTYDDTDPAGGAKKNRIVDATFEAPAGRYVLVYTTDGSHSWHRWNSPPPHDPAFWGALLRPEDPAEAAYASAFDYEDEAWKNVIVEMTRAGEEELLREGFTVKKKMDVRVYAIGEGDDGEMADYGWIVNAKTRQRVWTMRYDDTEHAGGGEKNRMFDGTVTLEPGSYMAYFVTDRGHSYARWNTAPPADRERYGLTVAATSDADAKQVGEYVEEKNGDYLVRLVEVGDDEYLSEDFEVKKQMDVYVFAIGEGQDGRMYDYGWIEDVESGRVVWEMTYRKTEHAGGARKNRMYADTLTLKPGKYRVFYETDDSHSYPRFNASRPFEPENWGIQILATK